jgi:hypothetical protein
MTELKESEVKEKGRKTKKNQDLDISEEEAPSQKSSGTARNSKKVTKENISDIKCNC